jgi:hypothetical protein
VVVDVAANPPAQQQAATPQQQPTPPPPDPSKYNGTNPQDRYYGANATLAYYKGKLNDELKKKNPQGYTDYFKGLQGARKTGVNGSDAEKYIQDTQYNDYLSPDDVKKTLGDKDYQNYINSLATVNQWNVSQGKGNLSGTKEGQADDYTKLNYGRRFASLTVDPRLAVGDVTTGKSYARQYNYNPQTGQVETTESGDSTLRPAGFGQQPAQQPPQNQTGGNAGIRVSDPNDPRFRKYNDSSAVYNYGRKSAQFLRNPRTTGAQWNANFNDWDNDPGKPAWDRLTKENGQEPQSVGTVRRTFPKIHNGTVNSQTEGQSMQFKKPEQPYEYHGAQGRSPIQQPQGYHIAPDGMPEPVMNPGPMAGGPTNFSYSGMDTETGQQVSRYFPDLDSWQRATDAGGYLHRDISNNGNNANATGYQPHQNGGYAVGDEVDLTPAEIKKLKKQGYKIQHT